jgi:hypothetical protein
MPQEGSDTTSPLARTLALIFGLPWVEIVAEFWRYGRKLLRGLAAEGTYQVLDYECAVELVDKTGKLAIIHKRERVRYLQDYLTTFQDQAWGDGRILLDYRSSPGTAVDQFQLGHNTYKLISLREFRSRGDIDEFEIQWKMQNGFLKETGFWGTSINHRTKHVTVNVIFPKGRPPLSASLFETKLRRTRALPPNARQRLPDGRYLLAWEMVQPRLYEDYILRWEW